MVRELLPGDWSALRPSKGCSASFSPAATRGATRSRSLSVKRCTGGGAGAGRDEPGALAAAKGGDRQQRRGTQSGEEELWLLVSAATMATVDLEKLRMSGAGKAIGVLTSGGDAQGDGARRRVYGWAGFLPVVGLLRRDRRPSP